MPEEVTVTESDVGSAEDVLNAPKREPVPKQKVRASFSVIMDADVNRNEFKNWLKACPFSHEGGQTINWENLPVDTTSDLSGDGTGE